MLNIVYSVLVAHMYKLLWYCNWEKTEHIKFGLISTWNVVFWLRKGVWKCRLLYFVNPKHRVGRVLSFFSSRWNWDSPNPSPARECAPHPLVRGEGHTRWWERGCDSVWKCQFQRGDIHCGTLYMYVLCDPKYFLVNNDRKCSLWYLLSETHNILHNIYT